MIAILTEKPSVGHDIARIVGAEDKKHGYMEGNGYIVTWAFGHLVTLAMPEDYGINSYDITTLPIIPGSFILRPRLIKTKNGYQEDPGAIRQLKIIKSVFDRCDRIIVATDAGREGELIFRYIYDHLKCSKPFSRLWISSLTDKSIRKGLDNLKEGTDYDSLYRSAEARSQADWLIGINASRAYSIMTGDGNNSIGRVQTPTLRIICHRYNEYLNFKSQPYWQHIIHINIDGTVYDLKGKVNYFKSKEAETVFSKIKTFSKVELSHIEKKEVYEPAPLLHSLTSLQKEANRQYGYSADKTLSIAQKLYESKYITYPRTGSQYIPQDVFETIPELIEFTQNLPEFKDISILFPDRIQPERCVDDKKVTDHHALLITGLLPVNISAEQKKIYGLIVTRMLEAFSADCIKDVTELHFNCDRAEFTLKGWATKQSGWKSIHNEPDEDSKEKGILPDTLKEGDFVDIESHNMIRKSTKPLLPFTDGSLLEAMEIIGLGTPATRAAIIETLLNRGYIDRDEKKLIPTSKGKMLVESLKDLIISDVEMTAEWEKALQKIEDTPEYYTSFINGIKVHTKHITDELISIIRTENDFTETPYICPKCKRGKMLFYRKVAKCNNTRCRHIFYRETHGVTLNDEQLTELFKRKRTPLIEGFRSKKGKVFNAIIEYDKYGDWFFSFPPKDCENEPDR